MNTQMLRDLYQRQKRFFRSGKTRDIDFRLASLKKLYECINSFEKEILEAIYLDLRKEKTDAYATEIAGVYSELKVAIKNVRDWATRQKVPTPFFLIPAKSYIYKEPYGVALIIAPWNYPFQLTIMPLIGAIAAGNTAILKPSEVAPHTAAALEKMINSAFPSEYLHVVTGGVEETQALLDLPPDYIFFTGSVPVGKAVMSAAAKHLTPLTLELGGKSPAIIHSSADLKTAAERVCWGKFLNAGQTCIAPDYILVHDAVADSFLDELIKAILKFYGEDASKHPRYCRIINDRHFQRLTALIDSEKVVFGGRTIASDRYIEPTLLYPAGWDDPIMRDEIFGPILPIVPYSDLDDLIERINDRPKPLALYMFLRDKVVRRKLIRDISFGGGAVNNTIMHIVSHEMPFGGVGQSGMGRYHGRYSFEAFSHTKSILRSYNLTDSVEIAYPHKRGLFFKLKLKIMKYLP